MCEWVMQTCWAFVLTTTPLIQVYYINLRAVSVHSALISSCVCLSIHPHLYLRVHFCLSHTFLSLFLYLSVSTGPLLRWNGRRMVSWQTQLLMLLTLTAGFTSTASPWRMLANMNATPPTPTTPPHTFSQSLWKVGCWAERTGTNKSGYDALLNVKTWFPC